MKKILIFAALSLVFTPAFSTDVGVSVSIGQPGFYGRIDIGDYPPPMLIYQKPRYIQRSAYGREPIYLRVPPGHAKNWRKHCDKYDACGERVYFVQDNWYRNEYMPRYQERHYENQEGRRGDPRGNGNEHEQGNQRHDGSDRGKKH
jgi:hypothetical protein